MLVVGCLLLWLAKPGAPNAVWIALAGYAIALIGAEFAAVFNNAMMPTLVPPSQIGRLSGRAGRSAISAGSSALRSR